MLENLQLSSKEKKRLERFMHNTSVLSRKKALTDVEGFIMRQQLKAILNLLGVREPGKVLIADSKQIMQDKWPLKMRRLRALVNGQRTK